MNSARSSNTHETGSKNKKFNENSNGINSYKMNIIGFAKLPFITEKVGK